METVALWGPLPEGISADEFPVPDKGLAQIEGEIAALDQQMADGEALLKQAAAHIPSFQAQILQAQNAMEYSSVRNTAASEGGLVWLTGYVPADNVDEFKTAAAENRWAWAMDNPPDEDELVPTKVRYNKVTRLMIPIFDILGVVPGYREYDISFWFLAFFSLFFAMILGDAGYGVLLLIGAAILTAKSRKLSDATLLLWVLSIATILWGALTGTWFGLESAMQVPLLRAVTVPILANYPSYFGRGRHGPAERHYEVLLYPGHAAAVSGLRDEHQAQAHGAKPQLDRRPGLADCHLRHLLPGPVPGHRRERPAGSRGRLCGRGLRAGGALRRHGPE